MRWGQELCVSGESREGSFFFYCCRYLSPYSVYDLCVTENITVLEDWLAIESGGVLPNRQYWETSATWRYIAHPHAPQANTMSPQLQRKSSLESASAAFRAHLPDLSTPRFTIAGKQDVYEYAKFFQDNHAPPWLFKLTEAWVNLYQEPFKGVTNDGKVRQGLFETKDEGVNIEHIVERSQDLFRVLDEKQRERLNYPINSNEWRAWSNPEILLRPLGLRLEEGMFSHVLAFI